MTKVGIVALSLTGVMLLSSFALMAVTKAEREQPQSNTANIREVPRHPVTPQMAETAANLAKSIAPDFELPTGDDKNFHLLQELQSKPVLVIMTKDGCPCSIESQPFFSALAAHYADKLTTVGVIDGDKTVANKYRNSFKPPYQMAYSEDTKFFQDYKSKQSVYTYLINPDGTLNKVWPGYSKASLVELNDKLAELTGLPPATLDLQMAPTEMTSGCYFFTDVGASEPSW